MSMPSNRGPSTRIWQVCSRCKKRYTKAEFVRLPRGPTDTHRRCSCGGYFRTTGRHRLFDPKGELKKKEIQSMIALGLCCYDIAKEMAISPSAARRRGAVTCRMAGHSFAERHPEFAHVDQELLKYMNRHTDRPSSSHTAILVKEIE